MKLAFVYDALYPWVKGGAERRVHELGKRLAENGHEVHVFGVKWWDGADIIKSEGMVLHGVCKPMELYVRGRRSITEAMVFSVKLFLPLFGERFDVIEVNAFPYFSCFSVKLVSILRRTPMIITWHEVWGNYWYEYLGWQGFFGKLVEFLVSKLAHTSIAVSARTKGNLGLLGTKSECIHIVPNGIDLKKISSIPPSPEKCDVIFVGRLIREKNVDMLLEAINYVRNVLPGVKCYIIGDGPEKKHLVELANTHELGNVRFFGFMEYEEVIAQIKSSKILVLPSSREGFGMVVMEAFGCRVPVITVRYPQNAANELVSGETGIATELDAGELCNAISMLITDSALRKKMAFAAADVSREFDWDAIAARLSCLYESILQEHRTKLRA